MRTAAHSSRKSQQPLNISGNAQIGTDVVGTSRQNRTIVDTQTRTSAHMTDVVRCIHLDQKTVGIMKFERFLGITVEFQIEFR